MFRTLPDGNITIDPIDLKNYGAAHELMNAMLKVASERAAGSPNPNDAVPAMNAAIAFLGGAVATGLELSALITVIAACADARVSDPSKVSTKNVRRSTALAGIVKALAAAPAEALTQLSNALETVDLAALYALITAARALAADQCDGCPTCNARGAREALAASAPSKN